MNTHKNILTVSILALLLIATAAVAEPVEVHVSPAGLGFVPQAASAAIGYQLSVTGPDGYLATETYLGGDLPHFATGHLVDGPYNWELKAIQPKPASADRAAVKSGSLSSGGFLVKGGFPADPTVAEGFSIKAVREDFAEKAQVFVTDLIVQGSACVGFDCTSSESFGFDTLRLKENNLRIHFDDTSSSASFPGNDWRLQANDSSNGGANYFAIEDSTAGKTPFKVEAGAKTNALYVEDDGDVGVGTSNPVVRMHLVKGDSPALRLEQDGSSGFTPQSWDLAGNETNFFIRDVTNGSKLPFRIKPGAPDNAIFIDAEGDVGSGTDSPTDDFHVRRTDADRTLLRIENTNATTQNVGLDLVNSSSAVTTGWNVRNNTQGEFVIREIGDTVHLTIDTNGALSTSGTVTPGSLSTGGNAGSNVCIDANGALCSCGSCA